MERSGRIGGFGGHRSDENYNSVCTGMSEKNWNSSSKIRRTNRYPLPYLWGVGDHGGVPPVVDLTDVTKLGSVRARRTNWRLSTPIRKLTLKREKRPKTSHPVVEKKPESGCRGMLYVSGSGKTEAPPAGRSRKDFQSAKRWRRRQSCYTARNIRRKRFTKQLRASLFAEFHDALPGSGTQQVRRRYAAPAG